MTGTDERDDGVPGDEAKAARKAAKRAARVRAKADANAAKASAKEARKVAKAQARAEKAVRRAATTQARAEKAEAKAQAEARAKAAKAQAKAAKARAKEAKRVAKARAAQAAEAGRPVSPAAAAAGAVLEEAAHLLRRPEAEPGEPVGVSEPETAALELEAEPEPEPEAVPEAVVEEEPAGPAPEPIAEAGSAAEPEPPAEPEPAAEAEPEPEPEERAEAEAAAEAVVELIVEPEPEPAAEADTPAEPEPEAVAEAGHAAGAEAELREASEPEHQAAPVTGASPGVGAEAEMVPVMTVEPDAERQPILEPDEPTPPSPRLVVPPGARIAASIDVGATSVHLLVGAVEGHRVAPLLDESVFLGLGDRVSADGFLGGELRTALAAELERYAAAARELGATSITAVGTDPMRRAADAAAVVHEAGLRAGLALHVLDHAEEGLLTLIGATGGSPVRGELLLVDIGGGSSEFVVVGPDRQVRAVGLPLGAARLTQDLVKADPPSLAEIEALRREVARRMDAAPEASPTEIVAVGGTATNLLRLLPTTTVDQALTRRRIAVALAMLTVERSAEAATRHVIRPERARILPAGAVIIDAILERYGADRLRVSEAGIREGAILAALHGGPSWRDRLAPMARGWAEATSRS